MAAKIVSTPSRRERTCVECANIARRVYGIDFFDIQELATNDTCMQVSSFRLCCVWFIHAVIRQAGLKHFLLFKSSAGSQDCCPSTCTLYLFVTYCIPSQITSMRSSQPLHRRKWNPRKCMSSEPAQLALPHQFHKHKSHLHHRSIPISR